MSIERYELDCPCCGLNKTTDELINKLKIARIIANTPFVVTSGTRCEKHNAEVGGSPTSSHKDGTACDIAVKSDTARWSIVRGLLAAGFKRILLYKNFVHVDVDHNKLQPLIKIM